MIKIACRLLDLSLVSTYSRKTIKDKESKCARDRERERQKWMGKDNIKRSETLKRGGWRENGTEKEALNSRDCKYTLSGTLFIP